LPALMKFMEGSTDITEVPNVAYRSSNSIKLNPLTYIDVLDDLPFPDWSLFDYSVYYRLPTDKGDIPLYQINSSRGCPYSCTFCSPLHGKKVRYRSASSLLAEITFNNENHDARHFDFADSNMTLNKERFIELCACMEERELGVMWNMETRVDLVDEEVVQAAYRGGCQVICYGIESGDQDILRRIGKSYTLDQVETAVQVATEAGLLVKSSFILGHPYETGESAEKTLALARRLRKNYGMDSYCGLVDVYPDSLLYHMAEKEDGCRWAEGMRNNWDAIQRNTATLETDELDKGRLESLFHQFSQEANQIPAKDYYKGRTKGN